MTRERLLRRFDRMESKRQALLMRLDAVGPDRLATSPRGEGWSVAQVLTHLAQAEESSLAYLRKKLEVKRHGPVGLSSTWRLLFLNTAIALPLKYKAPAMIAEVPVTSYAIARIRWDRVREAMRTAYSELDEASVGHDLFKHPIAGRLSLGQGLRFMNSHMRRHIGQIDRILRAVV